MLLAGEELARKLSHERRLSAFADAIGTLHLYASDPAAALERNVPAVEADRAAGDEHSLARGLNSEAQTLLSLGRTAEAVERAAESDHYARRLVDSTTSAHAAGFAWLRYADRLTSVRGRLQ